MQDKIIFDRLKDHVKATTDADVARALEISPQAYFTFKKKGKLPSDLIIKYCLKHSISVDWLLTGEGVMRRERASMVARDRAIYNERCARIDVFSLAGAARPKELTEQEPIESLIVPKEFSGLNIVPVKVRGMSMYPTIWDGAILGIDTADRQIVSGEIYAVWIPYEGAVIKRLFMEMDKVVVKSDNKEHPSFSIPYKELEAGGYGENFIQGRVKWVIQKK